ncbi:MAG: T9SS type A sorting domain-containing protein [Lewinellaceae bacterium]|nr:T9SS type A sorting domain-containing protein [Lewinellaceae bacterium]
MISGNPVLKTICFLLLWAVVPALKSQTYPIGQQVITYQDPARSNRNIQTYLYYPATSAGTNTPVAAGDFPIIVIGHGFTMNYSPYVFYADTLVPQGYIVAIPNTETGFLPNHTNFGLDLKFLVDKLYAENSNSNSPFFQHILQESCIMGHSMGGGCTYLGASNNPNVSTTITLAMAETNPSAIAAASSVNVPSLVFSATDDCVTPAASNQTPAFNNLPACKVFVSIIDGGHCNFATYNFNCNFGEMTCNPGGPPLSGTEQRAIVCKLIQPWLDYFLKSDPGASGQFSNTLNTAVGNSEITAINACSVFPVELLSFSAAVENDLPVLRWQTATELNTKHFLVERSTDGKTFAAVGTVAAAGYSTATSTYRFEDHQAVRGMLYYRLKIEDLNGVYDYSPIESLRWSAAGQWQVYPNPANTSIVISRPDGWTESISGMICNSMGEQVQQFALNPLETPLRLNIQTLPPGSYWLQFIGEGLTAQVRFIKS